MSADGALELAQPVPGLYVAGVGVQQLLQVGDLPLDCRRRRTRIVLVDVEAVTSSRRHVLSRQVRLDLSGENV